MRYLILTTYSHLEISLPVCCPSQCRILCSGVDPCHSVTTSHIHCISNDYRGLYQYESLAHTMETHPDYQLYVSMHDDVVVNPYTFKYSWANGRSIMAPLAAVRYKWNSNESTFEVMPNSACDKYQSRFPKLSLPTCP